MDVLNLGLAAVNLDPLLSDLLPLENRQRLLRLPLGPQDNVVVPLEQITEVIRVEIAEILPVPETSPWVLGICDWRGEMLWIVDLCSFVRYPSPFHSEQSPTALMVMVVQVDHQSIGIGVQQINDVELHDLQHLQPVIPGLFPPELLPLVIGLLPEWGNAVLNLKAIADCSL